MERRQRVIGLEGEDFGNKWIPERSVKERE